LSVILTPVPVAVFDRLSQLSVQLIPKVHETYGTGRIEAQAQSARQTANKPFIGKNLLNGANSAHLGPECCRFGDNYLRNENNPWR
jgi:hypothetical protein